VSENHAVSWHYRTQCITEEFQYKKDMGDEIPGIRLPQKFTGGSVRILSLRLNGTECAWHWEDGSIIVEGTPLLGRNEVTVMIVVTAL
jgi:hypothetical protein